MIIERDSEMKKTRRAVKSSESKASPKGLNKKKEINGPKGLEPTRYGDWESKGRCYDF